ncbi:MAG: hypothetical protein CK425_09765 [Parachlamydia sp.]|nr:MAG: hypothetical protein CK425_09765 [Parachlamydia sp.]
MDPPPLKNAVAASTSHFVPPSEAAAAANFSFTILADFTPLKAHASITPMLSNPGALTELVKNCLIGNGSISFDLGEMEEKLIQDLNKIYGEKSSKEMADRAIEKLLHNKVAYIEEIFRHINKDVNLLSNKFAFHTDEVAHIHFSFPSADVHNTGKSPVIITFTLKNEMDIKIVYKPREMLLEQIVCDEELSLFNTLKELSGVDLPTYKIFSVENYGYSEFIEGKVVYDEALMGQVRFGDASGTFLKVNPKIKNVMHYLELLALRKKALASKEGALLLDKPELVHDSDFCNLPHIQEILTKIQGFPASLRNPAETVKLIGNIQELAALTFFADREKEQLNIDYLLFSCLKQIKLVDIHAGNFILAIRDSKLFPIDIECFDDPNSLNADHILPQIEAVFQARGLELPLEDLRKIEEVLQDLMPEFEKTKSKIPVRYLPLTTNSFVHMLGCRLRGESARIEERCFLLMESLKEEGFELVDDYYLLEREMLECYDQFEIPYFILKGDQLFLNDKLVGIKTTIELKNE